MRFLTGLLVAVGVVLRLSTCKVLSDPMDLLLASFLRGFSSMVVSSAEADFLSDFLGALDRVGGSTGGAGGASPSFLMTILFFIFLGLDCCGLLLVAGPPDGGGGGGGLGTSPC